MLLVRPFTGYTSKWRDVCVCSGDEFRCATNSLFTVQLQCSSNYWINVKAIASESANMVFDVEF